MDFISVFDVKILQYISISVGFIFADVIVGWIKAILNKEFDISKAPQFLATNIFPYIGGLIIIGLMANFISEIKPIFFALTALVDLKFGKEIIIEKILGLK